MAEQHGYAGKILQVDLSNGVVSHLPTSVYSDRFLGGRGMAAKLYWDSVGPEVRAFDPENRLILVTGPLAGYRGLAGSRWQVCGKTPATRPQHFSYCNLGGSWGVELKFAGYDGMVISGKADKPVYILVQDNSIEIRDASHLWGQGAIQTRNSLKEELGQSARVLTIGPAGENRVVFANLLADEDSSGSSGLGAVCGSKNLKAVVVRASQRKELEAADPEGLKEIVKDLRQWVKVDVPWQPWSSKTFSGAEVKRRLCWGCINGCMRGRYTPEKGQPGKFMCESSNFYRMALGRDYERPTTELNYRANKWCDDYGMDTFVIQAVVSWLIRCHKAGILTDSNTGLPLSKMGDEEFIERLIGKIANREGFGDVLAEGLDAAAEYSGKEARELLEGQISKAGEAMWYEPRLYITTSLFYAMEPRRSIHLLHEIAEPIGMWLLCSLLKQGYYSTDFIRRMGKTFHGSELAFDFSTYEGKALSAKRVQDRQYIKESLILCDVVWPLAEIEESEDHLGDPALESRILKAVTGAQVDETGLQRLGERIWNLQRAVLIREGHRGRESDTLPDFFFTVPLQFAPENPRCTMPGKDGEVISRKGEVVDRQKFEEMKEEYYKLRGWDVATGLQTRAKLQELELGDIALDLGRRGLIL
jgi:aldehyde:ferredoxin oxidoreductase